MGKNKTIKKRSLSELRQVKTYGYKPPVAKKVKERPLEKWEQELSNKANNKSLKQFRYDKRRAIDCKLIKRSTTHKGFCKYMVTIGEKDGTTHQQPVYGKDMQDALSRLLWHERTEKVVKVAEKGNGTPVIALALVALAIPAIYTAVTDNPIYLLWTVGILVTGFIITSLWENYVDKAGKLK